MDSDLVSREILAVVHHRGPVTRGDIVRLLDLPKSTVAEHVRMLLRRGDLAAETPGTYVGRGRPAEVLMPGGRRRLFAVAALSHGDAVANGAVVAAILDATGSILWRQRSAPGNDPLRTCERLVRAGGRALSRDLTDVDCLTLVVPLPVAGSTGSRDDGADDSHIQAQASVLGTRPHLLLGQRLGVLARLANDADVAALGEARFGASRGGDMAYLKTISGLGMGIVSAGRLHQTPGLAVGEIAHFLEPGSEAVCACGAVGCWFAASFEGLGLAAMARAKGAQAPDFASLERACAAGDRRSLKAVETIGQVIGGMLAPFYLLWAPPLTLLEYGLGAAYQPLANGLKAGVGGGTPHWATRPTTEIRRGALEVPELLGAILLADH